MITILLAVIQKYGKNDKFEPVILYVGTVMIDLSLIEIFCK